MPEIHIILEQHVCRLTTLVKILCLVCPEEKMFTTPNHLFYLDSSLDHEKLLSQTVWALFQSQILKIDTFLLWVTSLQSISRLQPYFQSKILS